MSFSSCSLCPHRNSQDGGPPHHHTVHLGSTQAPCIHCSKRRRHPLHRQGRSKDGKGRMHPGETTVFSVGRYCSDGALLHEVFFVLLVHLPHALPHLMPRVGPAVGSSHTLKVPWCVAVTHGFPPSSSLGWLRLGSSRWLRAGQHQTHVPSEPIAGKGAAFLWGRLQGSHEEGGQQVPVASNSHQNDKTAILLQVFACNNYGNKMLWEEGKNRGVY